MNFPPVVSKLFYAILLSPLQSKQPTHVPSQFGPNGYKSRYKRTISMLSLVDSLIPRASDSLSHSMYKNNRFPWRPVENELIAYGSGAAVFEVNWKNSKKVLRIYRKSLGKPLSGLIGIAGYYKRNYEKLIYWYGSSPGLVLPMDFLVFSGLPFAIPVAASLQPYVHGQKQDLFEDLSEDQLLGLLETNDRLREQFIFFARQTLRQWEERKTCFDFLGRENLMLVNQGGDYSLRIVDVGFFELDAIAKEHLDRMPRIEQRMERLVSLYELAKEM